MYTPFGEMWVEEASTVDISNITRFFTNQQYDKESGLYYYNARYYDPHLGSFITPDPAMANLNHYAYSSANPIRYSDPTGLLDEDQNKTNDDKDEEQQKQEEAKKAEEEYNKTKKDLDDKVKNLSEKFNKLKNDLKENNKKINDKLKDTLKDLKKDAKDLKDKIKELGGILKGKLKEILPKEVFRDRLNDILYYGMCAAQIRIGIETAKAGIKTAQASGKTIVGAVTGAQIFISGVLLAADGLHCIINRAYSRATNTEQAPSLADGIVYTVTEMLRTMGAKLPDGETAYRTLDYKTNISNFLSNKATNFFYRN